MADASVEFLLRSLQELLIHHYKQIQGVKTEIENLENYLRFFKAIHIDSIRKRPTGERFRVHVNEINDTIHEAEDIIDKFVTHVALNKSQNIFSRAFTGKIKLHGIAKEVDRINISFQKLHAKNTNFNSDTGDEAPEEIPVGPPDVQDEGFEEHAKTIIGYLTEKKQQLDVVSIIGMPGVGKTTLAGKIFKDEEYIEDEFPTTRLWIHVSSVFDKTVFLTMWGKLKKLTYEKKHLNSAEDLGKEITSHLENEKFFIVIDNVSTNEDWDKIKSVLPKNNSTAGKVLITSPYEKVARYANKDRSPHKLDPLTTDEGWLLLQSKVFDKSDSTKAEFEDYGRSIVEHCDGLPLAIVGIGDILVTKYSASDDMRVKKAAWENVLERLNHQNEEEIRQCVGKVFSRSYNNLPHYLRACFLYLGMFPNEHKISAKKLIRMWIAEGFIPEQRGCSLEQRGDDYLEELVNRSLVKVEKKRRRDGKAKTCRIHNMIRIFCINEAAPGKDNFLLEIRTNEGSAHYVPAELKCRRICIHSSVSNFISSTLSGPSVRSFVCFSDKSLILQDRDTKTIPAAFNLLRVLDVLPLKFTKIPSEMYVLLLLRYISLSFNLADLPEAFAKLWNLETLIADTTSPTLAIKADIWKLSKLRHLVTNASARLLPKAGKTATGGQNLRTLGMISPQSCTKEVLDRCCYLNKLKIRGKLALLLDSKTESREGFKKLKNLEKIKLLNGVYPSVPSNVPMPHLHSYLFPSSLKRVTLSGTNLKWKEISTIGLLENLKMLKLKDKAFVGYEWKATDGHFKHLEFLHIEHTDLTVWNASENHFPKLECLELKKCGELLNVPIRLAYIPNFRKLTLTECERAKNSANVIKEAKEKKWEEEHIKDREFKLQTD